MPKQTHRSAEQWQVLIDEQGQSGLTIAEYCRQRNLSRKTFYRQRKRLSARVVKLPADKTFIRAIKENSEPNVNAKLTLYVGSSRLVFPQDSDPVWLATILRGLA